MSDMGRFRKIRSRVKGLNAIVMLSIRTALVGPGNLLAGCRADDRTRPAADRDLSDPSRRLIAARTVAVGPRVHYQALRSLDLNAPGGLVVRSRQQRSAPRTPRQSLMLPYMRGADRPPRHS
jgi:hypothetical protein